MLLRAGAGGTGMAQVPLEAGEHPLLLEYYYGRGDATLEFKWLVEGGGWQTGDLFH